MKPTFSILTALSLLLCASPALFGQSMRPRVLDVAAGLPSNEIYAARVDRNGYVWVATRDGLVRWDGRSVTSFLPNPADSNAIASLRCYAILETSTGTISMGTVHGVSTFLPGRQAFLNIYPGGSRTSEPYRGTSGMELVDDTTFVVRGNAGDVRVGDLRTGVLRTLLTQTVPAPVVRGPGNTLLTLVDGQLVRCTQRGSTYAVETIEGSLAGIRALHIVADGTAGAWLVTSSAVLYVDLVRLSVRGQTPYSLSGITNVRTVRCSPGSMLIASGTGTLAQFTFTGGRVERMDVPWPAALPGAGSEPFAIAPAVACVTTGVVVFPSNGSVVVVYAGDGLQARRLPIATATLSDGSHAVVEPVHVDPRGRITAMQRGRGIFVLDPDRPATAVAQPMPTIGAAAHLFDQVLMLFGSQPGSAVVIRDGASGVSQYYLLGTTRLEPVASAFERSGRSDVVYSATTASDGRVWAACHGSVRIISDDLSVKTIPLTGAQITGNDESNIARRVVEFPDKRMWVLTDHGRYSIDPVTETMQFHRPTAPFTDLALNDAIVGVTTDASGGMWCYGYRQIGRFRANGGIDIIDLRPETEAVEPLATIRCLTVLGKGRAIAVDRRSVVEIDLEKNTYRRIRSPFIPMGREQYLAATADADGAVWAVTMRHIERFDLRTGQFRLVPLTEQHAADVVVQAAIAGRGMLLQLVASTAADVVIVRPAGLPRVRAVPPIHLEQLLVRDAPYPRERWLDVDSVLHVHYDDSPFTLRFSVVDMTYGAHLRFRYMLEGYDEQWVSADDNLAARYQNVPPGEYRFRVQVFDVDGVWKEPRAQLRIVVDPAWWQTIWLKLAAGLSLLAGGFVVYRVRVRTITERNRQLEATVADRTRDLRSEQERSERLLLNVLPESVAQRLKEGEREIADSFSNVSILFADLVGFTRLTSTIEPREVVRILNELFSRFDRSARDLGVERIKTIGDGYMAVCGMPESVADHGSTMAAFALDMVRETQAYAQESGFALELRIGIHCGDVVAAVVGENRFAYDIWGDAVNVASRMESTGEPGRIHVTEEFADLVRGSGAGLANARIEPRGSMEIKGKGVMRTYWIQGIDSPPYFRSSP